MRSLATLALIALGACTMRAEPESFTRIEFHQSSDSSTVSYAPTEFVTTPHEDDEDNTRP